MASKLKAVKPKTALPSKPKIAVMGKFGVGKTWGLLDFPSTYFIDTEGGANLPHYIAKLEKAGGEYLGIEQGSQDTEVIIDQIKALATEKHHFKTLVIDSLSKLFNGEITKEAERLGDKDAFGASKKPAVRFQARLMYWVEKIDMNVILVTHEKAEWKDDKQIGTLPDAGDKLGHELHLLLQIVKTGDTRKAFVRKTRLLGFPDGTSFEWNYPEFAKRYGKDIMETEAKPIIMSAPEQITEVKRLLETIRLTDSTKDKWISSHMDGLSEFEHHIVDDVIKHLKKKIEPEKQVEPEKASEPEKPAFLKNVKEKTA